MTLVRLEPWILMSRLHRELDGLRRTPPAARAAGRDRPRPVALSPTVDVHEQPDRYVLRADLPGVQPADIEVTADQRVLSLRAERRAAPPEGGADAARVERLAGTFARRFTLPEDADATAISARSLHGVLELSIPKRAKPAPRHITVEAA